jgi:deoxyribonuclease V
MEASWPDNIAEARKLQDELKRGIRLEPFPGPPAYIAGCDASYSGDKVIGAACLYKYPELELVQEAVANERCGFPYVPGYLSFREGPALMEAIQRLKSRPDLLIFDGQGIAHPRRMGIASHLGVILDIPSVGCAKSRLVGIYREPGRVKGARSAIMVNGRKVGAVLRTRKDVKPVFVSPGHRVDIEGAVDVVLKCTKRYRLPEPIRCAHRLAEENKGLRT